LNPGFCGAGFLGGIPTGGILGCEEGVGVFFGHCDASVMTIFYR